jgi:hypothetical protein
MGEYEAGQNMEILVFCNKEDGELNVVSYTGLLNLYCLGLTPVHLLKDRVVCRQTKMNF